MKSHGLGEEKISSLLIRLGLPATVAMLVNALYNLVDTIFLGRWVGRQAIAALTVAMPLQNLMLGLGLLVGVGAASLISRHLGAQEEVQVRAVVINAFVAALVLGLSLSLGILMFLDPILSLFGASRDVLPLAKEYMSVVAIGFIFVPMTISANNIFRSVGDAKTAMVAMLIGTGLNLLLDPLFILVLDGGIKGAAWATILSQFCAFLFLVAQVGRHKSLLGLNIKGGCLSFSIVFRIFGIGFSSFATQLSLSVVGLLMNQSLVFYGQDLALSAFGMMYRVHMFLFMPLFGVVQGMAPIVGFNYGAHRYGRVKESIQVSLMIITCLASLGALLILVFPAGLARIFTDEAILVAAGIRALRLTSFLIPLVGVQTVTTVIYQSLGKAKTALFLALSRQVLLTIPLLLLLPRWWGLDGVWLVYPAADLLAFLISGYFLYAQMKQLESFRV